MAPRKHPLPEIGDRFGGLTVIAAPFKNNRYWRILCRCDCGIEKVFEFSNLRTGNSTNCGCRRNEIARIGHTIHGDAHRGAQTRTYRIWCNIITRCVNPNAPTYKTYGNVGITMCNQWRYDYVSFRDWAMANNYQENLLIDRIDNSQGYSPDNCRWVTRKEQNRNRRNSVVITAFGLTKLLVEWAEDSRCPVSRDTLYARIYTSKWDTERAIATPSSRSLSRGTPMLAGPVL